MRQFTALLLCVVIVIALFSGVSLASTLIEGEIRLDSSSAVLSGDNYGTFRVTGNITTKQGALINKAFNVQVWSGGTSIYTGIANNGRIDFLVETNRTDPITYTVYADNIDCTISPANFDLTYGITLTTPLQFTYSDSNQETVSGTIKYADGSPVRNREVSLYWLDANGNLDGRISPFGLQTNTQGSFGFIVNGWGGRAGDIALVMNNYVHTKGKVTPLS